TNACTVTVREGSDFLNSLRLEGDYVVKIDVEGHEGEVIRGCRQFFERHPPKGIVFESTGHLYAKQDFHSNPAYTILSATGFRIFQIPKKLFALRFAEVTEWGPAPAATDFVAVRPDLAERFYRTDLGR